MSNIYQSVVAFFLTLSILALTIAAPVAFAKDEKDEYSAVKIQTIEVADGIYMLMGKGGISVFLWGKMVSL